MKTEAVSRLQTTCEFLLPILRNLKKTKYRNIQAQRTMYSVIHRAIELNNLGAAHLNNQNLRDAIWTLREGLTYLHDHHASDEQNATDFLDDASSPQLDVEPLLIPVKRIDQDPTDLPSSGVTLRAYSFCHPLLLDENAENIPAIPHLLLCVTHQISAVILFNYALAHHWMGMRLARTELHRSAVRLYHAAHNLVQAMEEFFCHSRLVSATAFSTF